MSNFTPSKYQTAVADWVRDGSGHALVEAVAGSGKTSTLVWLVQSVMAAICDLGEVVFLAFNKSIVSELAERLPKDANVATFHSLGFRVWRGVAPRVRVEGRKTSQLIRDHMSLPERQLYAGSVAKLVGLAKAAGLVPADLSERQYPVRIERDDDAVWMDIIEYYDVPVCDDRKSNVGDKRSLIALARRILTESIKAAEQVIDFDDMLYMPVITGCPWPHCRFALVDEAQDTNAIQRHIVRMLVGSEGRLLAVGDPCQAIYGFRGAGTNSMTLIQSDFDARVLPLSISYRCPRAVVAEAQQVVSHIESSPTAPEGKVETLAHYTPDVFTDDDAILCRNTAPLVDLAYRLIANGRGCRILGREIGQGLIKLVERLKPKGIEGLQTKLAAWQEREIGKAIAKDREDRAAQIEDQAACIEVLIDALPETERTVPALIARIENMFSDNGGERLTLCTVHKAKGLEWQRVFILDRDELMPSRWARRSWQKQQESNLIYVAVTRAKSELFYINRKGFAIERKSE